MKKNIKKLNKTNKFVGSSKKKHTVMEKKQKNNKKTVKINRKSIINKDVIENKKISKKAVEKTHIKKGEIKKIISPEVLDRTRNILSDAELKDYLAKNVGSNANNVLAMLIENSNVDEKIAEFLKLKLNETRRVLNLLNNYGIIKYNINKDNNGWLTFVWYMDHESVSDFSKKLKETNQNKKTFLPDDCNDFYICKNCCKERTVIIPFETAYDNSFKCVCGKDMIMIEKAKAEQLYTSFNKN